MKAVLRLEEGTKERDALNVIPMKMGDQNMGFDAEFTVGLGPAVAEGAQAGTAVKNEMAAPGRGEFETRRITAIAPSVAFDGGRGAADSPRRASLCSASLLAGPCAYRPLWKTKDLLAIHGRRLWQMKSITFQLTVSWA